MSETKSEAQSYAAPSATTALAPVSRGAFKAGTILSGTRGKYLKMLVYGPHGAGKTTLLASAVDVPSMGDVLVLTIEGGEIVFEDNPRILAPEELRIIKIDRIEQFQKAYEWLQHHVNLRKAYDATPDGPQREAIAKSLMDLQSVIGLGDDRLLLFRTIIIDSLSEVEAMNLSKILNLDALGLDAGDDMEVAGFPQFRKNMHLMQKIIRAYRDLDIHVLCTCAQAFTQDERKAYSYSPKLTGQLSGIIQGFFDVVGWLVPNSAQIDEKTGIAKRYMFVQPQSAPRADAKCRLASFTHAHMEDPTMERFMRATGLIRG